MKSRAVILLALITLVMGALAGCGQGSSSAGSKGSDPAGELTTVRVAYPQGSATLPVRLGQTQGIFEKHGLKLEATEGVDFATYIASLGKQYDLSAASPGIMFPAMAKMPLVAVAGMQMNVADPKNSVLVTNDPSINSAKDLAGKRIGVAIVTGSNVQALNYLLEAEGVNPKSVNYVQVGFAEQADQLKAGNVDAVVSAIPFWTVLEKAGNRVVFDVYVEASRAATGREESFNVAWVAQEGFANENPEVVKSFKAALAESIEFMYSNEAVAQAELVEWLGMDSELARSAPIPSVSAEITKEQMEPMLVIAEAAGVVPEGVVDLDKAIWRKD